MSLSGLAGRKPRLYPAPIIQFTSQTSLLDVIRVVDAAAMQIAVFVDDGGRLVGVLTDGDIRRALLKGAELNSHVGPILNRSPITVRQELSAAQLAVQVRDLPSNSRIPVLNADDVVLGIYRVEEISRGAHRVKAPVVLMAGGLGSRLRPYTDMIPKPMLDVGGKPILERIIDRFMSGGFNEFYISVNYKAEIIKGHFGDGSRLGATIHYLEECERTGTAGSLRMLPKGLDSSFFVMNGDLLTEANFVALLAYHEECNSLATMCLREYMVEVPYGVVQHDDGRLTGFQEKPKHSHFVNAGIYVLDPMVLEYLPEDGFFDMPSLFDRVMAEHPNRATVFPLREYWCDIGRVEDLERARREVSSLPT